MGDNPRVALYQAVYEAMVANKADKQKTQLVSVAGKCCESGDMLIWDLEAPEVAPGDILAVFCTGAYTYSMASNYNRLPRPAVVFVSQGSADLVVRRETYATLIANDVIPSRLESLEARSVEQAESSGACNAIFAPSGGNLRKPAGWPQEDDITASSAGCCGTSLRAGRMTSI